MPVHAPQYAGEIARLSDEPGAAHRSAGRSDPPRRSAHRTHVGREVTFDVGHPDVIDAVRRALAEDIGSGDITTQLCVAADTAASGRLSAREPMTLAGVELLPLIFDEVAPGACAVRLAHN